MGWPRIRMLGFLMARRKRRSSFVALLKTGVDAGNDDVDLGEHFVFEVERAVGEDVDFDSGKDADSAFDLLSTSWMCWMCSRARLSSRPLIMARFLEWSVMAMY